MKISFFLFSMISIILYYVSLYNTCWTEHWKIKLGMARLRGKVFMSKSEDYILSLPVGWSTDG